MEVLGELEGHLSKKEIAEWFKVTPRTIQNWIDAGKFPGAKMFAGQWFIPKDEVQTALEIVEVLPVKRDMTKNELAEAFRSVIRDENETLAKFILELQKETAEAIQEIKKESQQIREQNQGLKESIERHDQTVMALIREKQRKRPLAERLRILFKGN